MKFIYKTAVLIIILLTCFISSAQSSNDNSKNLANNVDCEAKFKKAKELYAKMYNSSSVVDYRKVRKNFYDKVLKTPGKTKVEGATSCKEMTLLGIKNNIEKTGFSNYEEALRDWENKDKARARFVKENSEFYEYMQTIKESCGENAQPFFLDLINEYGDDFVM